MKNLSLFQLLLLFIFYTGCGSCNRLQPIPKDKESCIGIWQSHSGFRLEINASGKAKVTQIANAREPDYNKLNIKVAPAIIEEMFVYFMDDSVFGIRQPLNFAKEYRIDHAPYRDGDTVRMILNGVVFIRR